MVKTYGWTSLSLGQDIEVTLHQDAFLGDVLDMSMFGPFRPGFTHEDARRARGSPTRTRKDHWGEEWYVYDLPRSHVEIGCYYYTSGRTPSACTWTLHSIPKVEPSSFLLDPQLGTYLQRATEAEPDVTTRSFEIATADGVQSVQLYMKSRIGPGAYWSDQTHLVRREGSPRGVAQQ
jgi:hypothetical protein